MRRVGYHQEPRNQHNGYDEANDGHEIPGDERAQAVSKQGPHGNGWQGNGTQDTSVLGLGYFSNVDENRWDISGTGETS